MSKPARDYQPKAEILSLFPDDVSGNAINGLGEHVPRRPSPVFWHEPASLKHGALQEFFHENAARVVQFRKVTSALVDQRGPLEPAPIADRRQQDTPDNWTARLRAFALEHEADLVGITKVREDWVFEGHQVAERWVVILGMAMDHGALSQLPPKPPNLASADEVSRQYNRAARSSKALADWIRQCGWPARAQTGPMAGSMTLLPAAIEAGIGQLGKHGSLINDTYGASFRISAVLTDLPLVADQPVDIGVDDFCAACQICVRDCPPDAIFETKQWVRGEQRWYVDFDKCLPYFIETYGCGICIATCPWSRPGVAPRLAQKMMRKKRAP